MESETVESIFFTNLLKNYSVKLKLWREIININYNAFAQKKVTMNIVIHIIQLIKVFNKKINKWKNIDLANGL